MTKSHPVLIKPTFNNLPICISSSNIGFKGVMVASLERLRCLCIHTSEPAHLMEQRVVRSRRSARLSFFTGNLLHISIFGLLLWGSAGGLLQVFI